MCGTEEGVRRGGRVKGDVRTGDGNGEGARESMDCMGLKGEKGCGEARVHSGCCVFIARSRFVRG